MSLLMAVLHRMAHLLGRNYCTLGRGFINGHEWLFTVCSTCGRRKPLAHSDICCPSGPGGSPEEGAGR